MPQFRQTAPALAGAVAMIAVGSSVAVSAQLTDSPVATLQALRYLIACILLIALARGTGFRVLRPVAGEWGWLLGVSGAGLLVFNLALVEGSHHAEPAVLGVAVACVPLVLALRGGGSKVLAAAGVVTAGALIVEGTGRADGLGVLWALVVFACEVGFTLMAMPVLGRHGPLGVSVHTTWLAALMFGVLAVFSDGPLAVTRLSGADALFLLYLALMVTALAFVLWYSAVVGLGAGRAGLLTGIAPVSAAGTGVLLNGELPAATVWLGMLLVAAGIAAGLGLAPKPLSPVVLSRPEGALRPAGSSAPVEVLTVNRNPRKTDCRC